MLVSFWVSLGLIQSPHFIIRFLLVGFLGVGACTCSCVGGSVPGGRGRPRTQIPLAPTASTQHTFHPIHSSNSAPLPSSSYRSSKRRRLFLHQSCMLWTIIGGAKLAIVTGSGGAGGSANITLRPHQVSLVAPDVEDCYRLIHNPMALGSKYPKVDGGGLSPYGEF